MTTEREVTLWPSCENYELFRSVCDDQIPETFDEFETLAESRLLHIKKTYGIVIEKIAFNPAHVANWCRVNFGKVDSNARRHYAAFIAASD